MTRRNATAKRGDERVSFVRPAALRGVEVLRADNCTRDWTWLHTTYSICTALQFDGVAEYFYRGRTRTARAKHLLVMEPGEVHRSVRQTAPATFRVLFVELAVVGEVASVLDIRPNAIRFTDAPFADARLQALLFKLHASLESSFTSDLEQESRLISCLQRLFEVGGTPVPRIEPGLGRGVVRRAREYLETHALEQVTLSELAQAAGVSKFHFLRQFHRLTGVPPHTYQVLLRVRRASSALADGAPIRDAATLAGFADASHLARHFKRILGVTPGEYATGGLPRKAQFRSQRGSVAAVHGLEARLRT